MTEERDDLVILLDEEGNEVAFELLDSFDMENGNEYVVLMQAGADVDEEEASEIIILRIEHGEEEDSFTTVEDEAELEAAFEMFKQRADEEFDFE